MAVQRKGLVIGVAVAVLVVALAGGAFAWVVARGGDPDSVESVATAAVDAAEELDVDAGVRLLCGPPSAEDRDSVEDLIASGQERAGTDDPDVDYDVSEVEGDRSGSFRVTITSSDEGLSGEELDVRVQVGTDGDRSCISGFGPAETGS